MSDQENMTEWEYICKYMAAEARSHESAAKIHAENAVLRAQGHIFHRACDPNDVPPPGMDVKAIVARGVAESVARKKARCDSGLHFVGCGHALPVRGMRSGSKMRAERAQRS